MTKTKYECNVCDRRSGLDYGPCILKVPYDSFPPEYCPYDDCSKPKWKRVRN